MANRFFDPRLLHEARPDWTLPAAGVGLGLLAGVVTVVQACSLSRAVSQAFLAGAGLAAVQTYLLAFGVATALRACAGWASDVLSARVAAQVKADLRSRLFARLIELGPLYIRGERSGDLTNTLIEGVESLDAYFSQYLPQLVLAALVPVTVLVMVFPLDPVSGIVFLLTAPLIPIFMVFIGSLADALTRRQWTALSRMSAHFLDVLQGLTTLKLFGRSRDQAATIAGVSDEFRDATLAVLRVAFLSALVLELLSTLSTAVVAVEVGLRLLGGALSFEHAFFVLILAPEFYLPLRTLGQRFHAGMAGVTAAQRIYGILEGPSTLSTLPATPSPVAPSPGTTSIRFNGVSYRYPGDRAALDEASFEIRPGEVTALVGQSGGGKSTVAQLLLRFIEPTGGSISVNGTPLACLPAEDWRRLVAWVPQDPYLFYGTVADNIRLASPEADDDQVEAAARLAGADVFIRALPEGYDTVIGERGARLSGGEGERIAVARAFLKDAPFLIFDEATANLDPEHAAAIGEVMGRLVQGRTALVITHRLETIERAGQIIVLSGGRVVQAGTHPELFGQEGLYRRLVEAAGTKIFPNPLTSDAGRTPGVTAPACAAGVPAKSPPSVGNPREFLGRPSPVLDQIGGPAAAAGSAGRTLLRLLAFVAPFWPWVALSILLGFLAVASGIGLMAASAWIIASAALHPSIAVLQVAIVGVRFFGLSRGVFRYLERLVSHQVTFRLLARVRVWFYTALEPLAPARLSGQRSGDLLARIVSDVETLQDFYVRVLAPPGVAVMTLALIWVFVGSFERRLAAVLLFYLVLAGAGVPLLTAFLSRQSGRRSVAARAELSALVVEGIQGMADLVAFNQARSYLRRVNSAGQKASALRQRIAAAGALNTALGLVLSGAAIVSMLVTTIPLAQAGRIEGVSLAVLLLTAAASFEAVLPLPLAAEYLEGSLAAGRRLFDLVAPPEPEVGVSLAMRSRGPGDEFGRDPGIAAEGIAAEGLTFAYAAGQPVVLDDVSFVLHRGGRLALVGPSGSGKTTLINLLLGFWEHRAGRLEVFGREVRDWPDEDLRAQIGVVSQGTHLFNATIRDNLLMARPDAGEAEMIAAAKVAQIHDFITSLPDGYDTWVGERGLRLSGGERQRLSVARCLLKDAPLLILDEATTNLDPLTARSVTQATERLMAGRSVLTITHHLAGLEDADEIIVLRAGRIVERGSHGQLLALGRVYARMWAAQRQAAALEDAGAG